MIIQDLGDYIEYANAMVRKGELTMDNLKTLQLGDNHHFPHSKNLESRLKRLRALLVYSKTRLSSSDISTVWDILIMKSELRENDQNIFFNWFKTLLGKDQKKLLTE